MALEGQLESETASMNRMVQEHDSKSQAAEMQLAQMQVGRRARGSVCGAACAWHA